MTFRAAAAVLLLTVSTASADDWLQWRGPTSDNHAPSSATAPTEWTEDSGLAWKTAVPGRGHSSPTVVGDRIYFTTGEQDSGVQSLLILDRATGELLRQTETLRGNLPAKIHNNNSHASPTIASDGQRVYSVFHNNDAIFATAYDLDGEILWQKRVAGYDPQRYQFGYGASPRLVGGLLIVAVEVDNPGTGIYALDPATGEQVWMAPRMNKNTFSTPAVATIRGKEQLLMSGAWSLGSYDVASGEPLWLIEEITAGVTCGTMIWDEGLGLAFASGGFPEKFTAAIQLDEPHEIVWQNNVKCYEQSMLLLDGYIYSVSDSGVFFCWRATDGKEMWKKRLGGKYSSSPLLVDGAIYVTNEGGTVHVFEATPDKFVRIAKNQLGDSGFATPTPIDGRLIYRYGKTEGDKLQEYVVAVGE